MEPVSAVMRVWVSDDPVYGEPFEWSCTVRFLRRDAAELLAYRTPLTMPIRRALLKECQRWGLRKVLAVRYRFPKGLPVRDETWIDVPVPSIREGELFEGCASAWNGQRVPIVVES
jgi:hypothetical protein